MSAVPAGRGMAVAAGPTAATLWALALLNFFLADARDGLGPFLDAFLTTKGWQPMDLGMLATIGGAIGLAAGVPAGAFADRTRSKRLMIVVPIALITAMSFLCIAWPQKGVVFVTQALAALAGVLIAPALTGITLGVVGPKHFGRQLGRNEAWNHAGNVVLLGGTWGASAWFGLPGVAGLMLITTVAAIVATLAIAPASIDHAAARGLAPAGPDSASVSAGDDDTTARSLLQPDQSVQPGSSSAGNATMRGTTQSTPASANDAAAHAVTPSTPASVDSVTGPGMASAPSWRVLAANRPLLLLSVALLLFHFGNAPLARLISQQFALQMQRPFETTAVITMVSQLSALAAALAAQRIIRLDWVRAAAVLAVLSLPLRGVLAYTFSDFAMIYPVQLLDGLGVGLLGILTPFLVERLTRGSGHFNMALAAVLVVQGVGAASSNVVAGFLVAHYGYALTYLLHGGFALLALAALLPALAGARAKR